MASYSTNAGTRFGPIGLIDRIEGVVNEPPPLTTDSLTTDP